MALHYQIAIALLVFMGLVALAHFTSADYEPWFGNKKHVEAPAGTSAREKSCRPSDGETSAISFERCGVDADSSRGDAASANTPIHTPDDGLLMLARRGERQLNAEAGSEPANAHTLSSFAREAHALRELSKHHAVIELARRRAGR